MFGTTFLTFFGATLGITAGAIVFLTAMVILSNFIKRR